MSRRSFAACMLTAGLALACSNPTPSRSPDAEAGGPQRVIVDRAAAAFARMQQNPTLPEFGPTLTRARAVMIFPKLRKASLILGGEGGNGVLVARAPDGSWSDPAFYSLGAPSIGIQIGYQETSVVLFIMDEPTFQRILHSDFTLGTNTTAALGQPSRHTRAEGEVLAKPIYYVAEASGAFVGVSLDGYVTAARNKHNAEYYGAPVTPTQILVERSARRPESRVLHDALTVASKDRPEP